MLAIIMYSTPLDGYVEAKRQGLTIIPAVDDYIELRLDNGKMGYFCVTKREFVLDEGDNHVIIYCRIVNVYDKEKETSGNDIGI